MAIPYSALSEKDKKTAEVSLFDAILDDKPSEVQRLLDSGVPVEIRDPNYDNNTPLITAAATLQHGIVNTLLERGANVNAQNALWQTPLLLAVINRNAELVNILVDKGADVNLATKDRMTPIIASVGAPDETIFDKLLEKGADITVKTVDERDALLDAIYHKRPSIVQKLIQKGADVNTRMGTDSALIKAIKSQNDETIGMLIDAGADVNVYNSLGTHAIALLAYFNKNELVDKALSKIADINSRHGQYLLSDSVAYSRKNLFNKLIEKGIDVNMRDDEGSTVLFEHVKGIAIDPQIYDVLLDKGIDVNAKDNRGWTALMDAVAEKNLVLVEKLISKGAEVDVQNQRGQTALILSRNEVITSVLLDANANMNIQDQVGYTALHTACVKNLTEIATKLLEKGADPNIPEKTYKATPLMEAVRTGNLPLIKLLLQKGADVDAKNKLGGTAADYTESEDIKRLLVEGVDNSGPWKAKTQADVAPYYEKTGSFCPVCLAVVPAGDQYPRHKCAENVRHAKLYRRYSSAEGEIIWCSICGRIVLNGHHMELSLPSTTRLVEFHDIRSNAGGEEECTANGGGGTPEKLKRTEMLLAFYKDVPTGTTQKKGTERAVEQAWIAPYIRIPKRIVETGEFSTPKTAFPAEGGMRRRTYRSKKRS
jgi:uncharacterized protein